MGKRNLFIVGDSHIKRVERDLIVHHLSDKNISLKFKNFELCRCQKNTTPSITFLAWSIIDCIIIHGGTNNISQSKLYTTWPLDLEKKIISVSNVCKSFDIAKIVISSVLPRKDLSYINDDATNNYLKELWFLWFFIYWQ